MSGEGADLLPGPNIPQLQGSSAELASSVKPSGENATEVITAASRENVRILPSACRIPKIQFSVVGASNQHPSVRGKRYGRYRGGIFGGIVSLYPAARRHIPKHKFV